MLDEAFLRVDPQQWGAKYDIVMRYVTLHLLQVWFNAQPALDDAGAVVPGSGGQQTAGPVHWEQVGTLQRGTANPTSSIGANHVKPFTDSWWESTIYGQAYTSMLAAFMPGVFEGQYFNYDAFLPTNR